MVLELLGKVIEVFEETSEDYKNFGAVDRKMTA